MVSIEEFVERLCLLGAARGPRRFPRRKRDRDILIKSIKLGLDSVRIYGEREINQEIRRWNEQVAPEIASDHVSIRRTLVDYGHLERTADGRKYRVGFPPGMVAFDLEIDELDLRATVAAFRDNQARSEAERRARHQRSG